MLHRNNKLVWTRVDGHNFDTECNDRLFCGYQQKNQSPQVFHCVFSNNKNAWFTEVTFMINMENNDDWLASNKTWKKWTRIGDGELLSYAGIDVQKPIDEERLVKLTM